MRRGATPGRLTGACAFCAVVDLEELLDIFGEKARGAAEPVAVVAAVWPVAVALGYVDV